MSHLAWLHYKASSWNCKTWNMVDGFHFLFNTQTIGFCYNVLVHCFMAWYVFHKPTTTPFIDLCMAKNVQGPCKLAIRERDFLKCYLKSNTIVCHATCMAWLWLVWAEVQDFLIVKNGTRIRSVGNTRIFSRHVVCCKPGCITGL